MQNRGFTISGILCMLLTLCVQEALYGQGLSPCWCVPSGTGLVSNIDSVAVDTCGLGSALSCNAKVQDESLNKSIWNERRYYAKKYWTVSFEQEVISLPSLPRDSVVYVSWQAVDSSYPAIRAGLQAIEQQYGSFRLRKVFPAEANGMYSNRFEVDFAQYVNAINVMEAFNRIPSTHCFFSKGFAINLDMPGDRALIPGIKIEEIQFAYPQTEHPPYLHKLGFQWNIYSMDLPLAWEITTGRPAVVLGAHDEWGAPCNLPNFDYSHPDLKVRANITQSGNFLYITPQYRGNTSNALTPTTALPLRGHGLRTLTCAIALGNNDNHGIPDTEQGRMIGVAFNCSGIGFYGYGTPCPADIEYPAISDYINIDTDFQNDGIMQRVAVMNFSQRINDYEGIDALIKAGTIVVAAAGNNPDRKPLEPSGFVYIPEINNPNKDYHVITVGGLQDGSPFRVDCTPDDNTFQDGGEFWKGKEEFRHNYPAGLTKFSIRTDMSTEDDPVTGGKKTWRQVEKSNSFSDVVAPCTDILTLHGRTEENSSGYNQRKYAIGSRSLTSSTAVGATSQSAPQVASICGLMVSVNRFLGVSYNQADGKPSEQDGPEVQRRAHRILTFTADKIEDDTPVSGTITQPQYVEQTDDPIRRSWAQRMGFGKANAYRAVAHAIGNKGSTSILSSNNAWQLPSWFQFAGNGNVNEQGKALLHFGSRVQIGSGAFDIPLSRVPTGVNGQEVNVLEYGGVSMPGSAVLHNNQGVTKLLGSAVQLSVPEECILVIDGIVTTDSPNAQNAIKTNGNTTNPQNDHGKILIAGYLDNVNVQGRIKVGDLVVHSTATNGTGLTLKNHGSINDPLSKVGSEIYGVVTLKDNASLVVDNNATLTLQPGGAIDMQGNKDVVLKSGATLVMEYPSTITGKRSVIVENGAKIIVKKKPSNDRIWRTELLAHVVLHNGAEMLVEEEALVEVGGMATAITVEEGGVFRCLPESRIIMRNSSSIVCNGKFLAVGQANRPVEFISAVDECGAEISKSAATIYTYSTGVGTLTGSLLDIKHCNFTNVSVWAVDMPTNPVEFCSFTSNRENPIRTMFTKMHFQQAPFLLVPTSVTDVEIRHCSFTDVKGDMELEDNDQFRGNDNYKVSGAALHGLQKVTVQNSDFNFLMSGVSTRLCDKVVVRENTFSTSDYGLHDDGSAVLFCKNICNKTERGNAQEFSRVSLTVDNVYDNVWSATYGKSAATQFVRNNAIKDFREGVYAETSPFVLRPQRAYNPPFVCYDARIEQGYNNFLSDDVSHVPSEFLEEDLRQNGVVVKRKQDQQRDIRLESNAILDMERGYNLLSLLSGYHLYKEQPPAQSVNVNYNMWSGSMGFAVRRNQYVNPVGTILNQEQDINKYCGTLYGCTPIASGLVCSSDPYTNDGSWTERLSTDPYLQQVYTNARQQMQNPVLDVMCRRIKAHDALQAAILGDQKENKLRQLLTDYAAMGANTSNPNDVRSIALVLRGETHERLGEKTQAITAYTAVGSSYPTSSDAEVAAWRLHYLAASGTGSVGSTSYEQALAGYRQRVLDDMRGSSAPAPHKRGEGAGTGMAVENSASLFAPIPNPSNGEVALSYNVGAEGTVRLVVADALGRELAVVVDAVQRAGQYYVQWDGKQLPMGVYTLRLEVAGSVYSQQLVVVK